MYFWVYMPFNFNGSVNILCVPLCAELDATVRKLISLICFDIFLPKCYRNALIGGQVCMRAESTRKKYCFGKHYF